MNLEWSQAAKLSDHFATFRAFFFGFGPRFNTPSATSQFGCLHFGQLTGLPSMRLTQAWPHRRQSQTILGSIGIYLAMIS
jgi:hypothetical protein